MVPTHTAAPSLAHLAELLHDATAEAGRSFLVTVDHGHHDVAIGTWPVPAEADHPADPLVGFSAPPSSDAIGLVSNGRVSNGRAQRIPGEPGPEPAEVVRATVLADRHGQVASVLERPGRSRHVITEPPEGWVPDALARALGRPTPPPTDRLARWVEVAWLDAVASRTLVAPGRVRTWAEVAHLHPLHPPGAALPGALLAVEAEAIDLESSWSRIRHLCGDAGPAPSARPPGGTQVPLSRWFDDGSFSRWVQRYQPPSEAILPAVLDALPTDLGAELIDALITITAPAGAP